MKTPAEIANHPKAHLHREVVAMLRAARSVEGAIQMAISKSAAGAEDHNARDWGHPAKAFGIPVAGAVTPPGGESFATRKINLDRASKADYLPVTF